MACHECQRARETAVRCVWYCPLCLWCGARLIRSIQSKPIASTEKAERCRKVLADWMAMGHSEKDLRALAKGPMPVEPPTSHENPTKTKRA